MLENSETDGGPPGDWRRKAVSPRSLGKGAHYSISLLVETAELLLSAAYTIHSSTKRSYAQTETLQRTLLFEEAASATGNEPSG